MTTGARWIDDVLARLADLGASDLVLKPTATNEAVAMVRIDGVRQQIDQAPAGSAPSALARLKALAQLPAYIVDEPQDGRIDGAPFGIAGDVRLAVIPTIYGGRAALRLPALGALPEPDALGLPAQVVHAMRERLRRPDGILFVSGPTGSGKTTTIHSFLRELASEHADRVLLTIEDPVERRLPGVVQIEANPHREFGFEAALRSALRQDADVLVVGEVRDRETATAAMRAALGGHLVIATVHAPRAADVVPRLREMGVPDEVLFPSLIGVLAQRLVRRVHAVCGGAGCADCRDGFLGRVPVCDWLPVGHEQRRCWHAGDTPALATDMDEQAAVLVAQRVTTLSERERVLAPT